MTFNLKLKFDFLSIILLTLFFALVFISGINYIDFISQDLGIHLTLGGITWQTHQIPTTNLFSYTAPNFPWANDTWLSKVCIYLLWTALGLTGLAVSKAVILTMAFALAFLAFYKKEVLIPTIVIGILTIFIFNDRTYIRPEMFSYIFLGWYLFVLFRKNTSLLWTLPLIQLLWVNTHIYFVLGPAIYAIFIAEKFRENQKLDKSNQKLLFIGLLIGLVNLINPLFVKGALYPLFVFQNYGLLVLENLSPFVLLQGGYERFSIYSLFLGIIITAVGFVLNYKRFKDNILSGGLFILVVVLSLIQFRNIGIFALAMLPINAKNFYEANIKIKSRQAGIFIMVILTILSIMFIDNEFYNNTNRERHFGFIRTPVGPQKAVDFVRNNSLHGPIFNDYNIGGFLIWKLPEEKVFIDSRPEAYPADFLQDVFIGMQQDPKKWELYSRQYNINLVFYDYLDSTDYTVKFLQNITSNPDWAFIYNDGWVAIFIKRTKDNADIIKKYEIRSINITTS